jgi:uncharacterized protein (DUF2141 family)
VSARRLLLALALAVAVPAHARPPLASSPDLGKAEGRCRPNEPGPALLVEATGLKDRKGAIKLEVYPADEQDFLADDNVLVNHGKTFRRVEQDLPDAGLVVLCIRVPAPGAYALALLHDRDGNHKFGWWSDGVGFPGYVRLGMHKPRAAIARINAGPGLTRIAIPLMYRHGLGVATLRDAAE